MSSFSEQAIDEWTVGEWQQDQALDKRDGADCTHPAKRHFVWKAFDGTLCICCCDCGEVLKGAAA